MYKAKNKTTNPQSKRKSTAVAPQSMAPKVLRRQKARKEKVNAYIASQIDPFPIELSGVKIPDANTLPSATNRFRGVFSATADANGAYASAFRPFSSAAQVLPLNITAGTISWSGGIPIDLNCTSTMNTNYELARTVAYGLRVKFIGSRMNSQGKVHIACVGNSYYNDAYGVAYYPTTPSQFEQCPWYTNFSLNELAEQEIVIPGRRIDDSSMRYRRPTRNPVTTVPDNGIEISDGWSSIVLFIEGANPSTTVVQIEVVYHFEGLVSPTAGSFQVPTPAAEYKIDTLQKAAILSSHCPVAIPVKDGSTDYRKVISMISTGASSLGSVVSMFNPVAGSLLSTIGRAIR